MRKLSDQIARSEICSEQLRIQLRLLPKDSAQAEETRSRLLSMLLKLVSLKGQREVFESSVELEAA